MQKLSLLLFFLFSFQTACAKDVSDLPENKQTPQGLYVTASEAYELKSNNPDQVYFIDVRTRPEVEFLGMPINADTNIPYMTNDLDEWDAEKNRFTKVPNSNFAVVVDEKIEEAGLNKDSTILLMCRSGTRSAKAAALLNQLGYSKAYTVVDGYEGDKAKEGDHKGQRVVNGWKNSNLPWTYKITEDKMYFE